MEQETSEITDLSLRQLEQKIKLAEMRSVDKALEDTRVELIAKDVFYRHPDSGILSRPGPIAVKIQSRLLKKQIVSGLKLSLQNNSKDTLIRQSKQHRKMVLEKEVNKKQTLKGWVWGLVGIMGVVFVFLWMRFFFWHLR